MTSVEQPGTFLGYPREQGAAGTRNHVVLLATSSRSSGFVTELARRFDGAAAGDGVVPVAHTEGGEDEVPNNLDFLLATLAGFTAEPERRRRPDRRHRRTTWSPAQAIKPTSWREHDYPSIKVPHAFFTRRGRLRARPRRGRRAGRAVAAGLSTRSSAPRSRSRT